MSILKIKDINGNWIDIPAIKGVDGTNGTDGRDGTDGVDGFSPIANVTQSGNVTTISITDKEGTTTANIDLSDVINTKVNISSFVYDSQTETLTITIS